MIGVAAKMPLQMGRQKADLETLILCFDLKNSTKITSSM